MLKFGFYDSKNGDRAYNADDMSRIFDGIIRDGVYQYCDDHMEITPENDENGLGVNIAAGRAWFNRTWTYVDSPLFLRVDQNNSQDDIRYDFVALVIDKRESARQNFFVICQGSPHYSGPVVEGQVFVHFFAKIKITRGAMVLHQSDITSYEGVSEFEYEGATYPGAPWVTGPLETISIDDLIAGWTDDMHDAIDAAIDDYFDGLTVATKPADLGQGYGVCPTAAATAAKTVSITDFKLTSGGIVAVKFNYGFQAGCTLNINNTGAKSIYYRTLPVGNDIIQSGNIVTLVYDGGSSVYRVLAIDAGVSSDGNVDNVLYFPIRNQGGQLKVELTSENVYNALVRDEKNIMYYLVDAPNRVTPYAIAGLAKKPTVNTEAIFTAIDVVNHTLYVYTLDNTGTITWDSYVVGSYTKPLTGIPETDLANDVQSKLTNAGMGQGYAVCSTQSSIYSKTAALTGYNLVPGGIIAVWFEHAVWGNISGDVTLSINSQTAKPMYYQGNSMPSRIIRDNDIAIFVFDGNYYHLVSVNHLSTAESIIANITLNNGVLTCDKTYSELSAAITSGQFVYLRERFTSSDDAYYRYYIFASEGVSSSEPLIFICTTGVLSEYSIYITVDDDTLETVVTKNTFSGFTNVSQGFGYAVCSTAAATAAKTADLTGYVLVPNSIVSVKFTYAVPYNATLSINYATAKNIRYHGSNVTSGIIQAGDIATFVYDGEYYHLISIDRQQSGGGGSTDPAFYVHINWDGSGFTCVETFADIFDAFDGTIPVIPILDGEICGWLGPIDDTSATFYLVALSTGKQYLYSFTLTSSDVLTMTEQVLGTGDANNPTVSTVSGSTVNITALNNMIYSCGELTSLTITDSVQNISFTVDFTSGTTPTTITVPSGYKAPGGSLTAEANKTYELNVRNGKAVLTAFEAVSTGA